MKNLVGTVFLSRFRVDTLLSAGAAGSLYRGSDLKRNLPLSIKVYETPVPYDPNALCFQQDDGTLQTLMHPEHRPLLRSVRRPGLQLPGRKVYRWSGAGPDPPAAQPPAAAASGSPDLSEDPGDRPGICPRFWADPLHRQPVQHPGRAGWHDRADQFRLCPPCRPHHVFLRHPGFAGL